MWTVGRNVSHLYIGTCYRKCVWTVGRNVSHLAQAQVPSQMANGGDMGSNEMCARCGGAVFFAERVAGMGKVGGFCLLDSPCYFVVVVWFF